MKQHPNSSFKNIMVFSALTNRGWLDFHTAKLCSKKAWRESKNFEPVQCEFRVPSMKVHGFSIRASGRWISPAISRELAIYFSLEITLV